MSSYQFCFGIDPGKSGSISVLWWDGKPYAKSQKLSETEADIADYFDAFHIENDACAVIEKVSASPQMGVTSAFTFGRSYGFLRGLLIAHKIPFVEVSPQKWQKAMGCLTGGNKNVSKAAAQQRWPNIKITHANADSLLIAEYCRSYAWSEK